VPAQAYRADKGQLAAIRAPATLAVGPNHCHVFLGLTTDAAHVRIFEPTYGVHRVVPRDAFEAAWTGEVIAVTGPPSPRPRARVAAAVGVACAVVLVGLATANRVPRNFGRRERGKGAASGREEEPS
jgi:hypothetical protein